jgi:predicted negative regulator of RcsB-dependent stress response
MKTSTLLIIAGVAAVAWYFWNQSQNNQSQQQQQNSGSLGTALNTASSLLGEAGDLV